MRADALGLWWRDEPPAKKERKIKEKRTPPKAFWLEPGYLPPDELPAFPHVMDDGELYSAYRRKDRLLFDVESYWNYFIVSFMSYATGHVVYFELHENQLFGNYTLSKLGWIVRSFTLVGFNSAHYDIAILTLAIAGHDCKVLKESTNNIIQQGWRTQDVLRARRAKRLKDVDHIDLIAVAPLDGSLKTYGGRLFSPYMQDLPFHPETLLTVEQAAFVKKYNVNDLIHTGLLLQSLEEQIKLREHMSMEFRQDLRSKSDAQVAEAVIANEWKRTNGGQYPVPAEIEPGTTYYYQAPPFLKFESPLMQWVLQLVRSTPFVVGEDGYLQKPESIASLHLQIGDNIYRMGMGGLHSSETTRAHTANDEYIISDRDVTSYYPQTILNQSLYPKNLGPSFLRIYSRVLQRRLETKKRDKKHPDVESLKIVVNGTFGKMGSKYSIFYSPNNLLQVVLTGQLSILMLIERLEIAGIRVLSGNTDGIVVLCLRSRVTELDALIKQWEQDTDFPTEEVRYDAYYTRDVNNYIAVKEERSGLKAKGVFDNPWNDPKRGIFRLHHNPVNTIILEAIELLLTKDIPVEQTIRNCKETHKFTALRKVTGGAVWGTRFLGRVVRWYHAIGEHPEIIYAKNGNKVPASTGAKPLMQLPAELPLDVDYDWYIAQTHAALVDIGYEAAPEATASP